MGREEFQKLAAVHDRDAGRPHQVKELLEGRGLLIQRGVDGAAKPFLKGWRPAIGEHIPPVVPTRAQARIFYNGQAILGTDEIAAPAQGAVGADEVPVFSFAIQCGAVPNYMRVDVSLVGMGADDESVLAFGKAHGKLVADAIGFLGGVLSRVFSEIAPKRLKMHKKIPARLIN